ncbi:hypothetical protein VTJ04DRAFT_6227 [Mycothermus thermophilus]|uniref:uncharacterized protein n=1 Tax=Humicola insolens TaxID=85995 RepID=UPI0037424734
MSPSPLEVPIFGPDSGPAAVLNGAGRLELNRAGSYDEGGLTPTLSELETLLSLLTALPSAPRPPIRVMIRPRGPPSSLRPDFIYTPSELLTMLRDIKDFASSGLLDPSKGDGFVLGVLRSISGPHGSGEKVGIDVLMNRMLMELVKGFDVPFVCVLHRAVDRVLRFAFAGDGDGSRKVGEVWKQVLEAGFDAVLTSGGPGNAMENIKGLREVLAAARAEKSAGNGNGRGWRWLLEEGCGGRM